MNKIETTIQYNILIVEDDFINAQFLKRAVVKLGHRVVAHVKSGDKAIDVVKHEKVHLVFMDINLEGAMDGVACARTISTIQTIPIIYTTVFSDSQTIDEATDTNLYGYLIKPFDYPDVEAMFSLAIKKNYAKREPIISKESATCVNIAKGYRYFQESKTLLKEKTPVELTQKESTIFYYLFIHLNQNVSSEQLAHYVWNDEAISASTIRNTILRLRKKIPDLEIATVSGIGYMLKGC